MADPQKSNWLAATSSSSSIAEQQKSNWLFNRISEGTFRPPGSLLLRMTLRHFRHKIRWCFAVSNGFRKWSIGALLSIDLHSTLYIPHFTHFTLLHSTLQTPPSTLYTPHFALHTPHINLHTLHSTLHILHSILHTLH